MKDIAQKFGLPCLFDLLDILEENPKNRHLWPWLFVQCELKKRFTTGEVLVLIPPNFFEKLKIETLCSSKSPNYIQSAPIAYYVRCSSRLLLFGMFKLPIFIQIDIENSYICTLKKAVLLSVWKKFWGWGNFCHGRLQTTFSKSSAFSNKVHKNSSGAFQSKNSLNFKISFKQQVTGLSFEVYNFSLYELV